MLKTAVACLALGLAAAAHAETFTTLTLPQLNTDIRTYTGGSAYAPLFPGTPTWNGTPFKLTVSTAGYTAYASGTLDIPVGVFGATRAYTIINSAFGALGANNGSLEFIGSSSTYRVDLIQGVNLRDHYQNTYQNVIDGVNAVNVFSSSNGDRLDAQIITLPGAFATQTLQTIRFTGLDLGSAGIPFIVAATVGVVPEPAAVLLFAAGAAGLAAARRRAG